MVEGNVTRDTNTLITARKVLALVNKIQKIKKKGSGRSTPNMTRFNTISKMFKNTTVACVL